MGNIDVQCCRWEDESSVELSRCYYLGIYQCFYLRGLYFPHIHIMMPSIDVIFLVWKEDFDITLMVKVVPCRDPWIDLG